MIVVDASATLELLLRTSAAAGVERRVFASGQSLHAPHLIDIEVTQVLRRYAMRGELGEERCREALADLADLPMERYPHEFLLSRIWELRGNLTAYDAAYVALAEALGAVLVTTDRRLKAAPGNKAKVELL